MQAGYRISPISAILINKEMYSKFTQRIFLKITQEVISLLLKVQLLALIRTMVSYMGKFIKLIVKPIIVQFNIKMAIVMKDMSLTIKEIRLLGVLEE